MAPERGINSLRVLLTEHTFPQKWSNPGPKGSVLHSHTGAWMGFCQRRQRAWHKTACTLRVELWVINPPAHTGGSWNLALINKGQWDLLLSLSWIDRMEGRAPVWEVEVKCWDVASAWLSPSLSFGFLCDPFMILLGKLFDLYVAISTSLERKKMKNTHLIRLLWGILRSS